MTMAAVCRAFGRDLSLEIISVRPLGPGEILVDTKACAICHSDILYIDGAWGGQLPAVYGHEAAGVVNSVGDGVDHVKPGDRVAVTLIRSCGICSCCSRRLDPVCTTRFPLDQDSPLRDKGGMAMTHGLRTGAFAEQMLVESSQVAPISDDVPMEVAALISCGVLTGFGAVRNTAKISAGSSVVVIGTGGVGLNAVQGARHMGADPIIAVDLSDDKLEAALSFGATHRVNGAVENTGLTVKTITGGQGADYVFVAVGSAVALQQGLELISPGGTVVIVGMPPSGVTIPLDPGSIAAANQVILGSKMGSSRVSEDIPYLVKLYQSGELKLDELVTGRYELRDINEALRASKAGEGLRNVVLF